LRGNRFGTLLQAEIFSGRIKGTGIQSLNGNLAVLATSKAFCAPVQEQGELLQRMQKHAGRRPIIEQVLYRVNTFKREGTTWQ